MGALLAGSWRHPRGPERAPRSMGIIFFQKNERHAAWERSWPAPGATKSSRSHPRTAWESFFFKKTSVTLHGSAPAAQGRPRSPKTKKSRFCIKNIDFSLEKCRFGATKGVVHYVLRRERAIFKKNDNFELEICVKPRGGRAARCMGTPPVAEMLASEARRARPAGHVRPRQSRVRRPLSMPFPGRSIERVLRDFATPSNYYYYYYNYYYYYY